jgi:UDP-glucose 4-epimerase
MSEEYLTVLVTGGAGFIGSHLVEALLGEGHKVRIVGRPSVKFDTNLVYVQGHKNLQIDQRDLLSIQAGDVIFKDVNVVFHLASYTDHMLSQQKPEMFININTQILTRILEGARISGFRIIYTSSASVYGKAKWPTNENQPAQPINGYGLSKWIGELLLQYWNKFYGIPFLSFRIFNGYGLRSSESGVFGIFLKNIMEGKPIPVTGDGSARRDFIYVDDIVDALICGASSEKSGIVYNVGTGVLRTVKELATLLEGEIKYIPLRSEEPPVYCADISRIQNDLGWNPKISLEEGVRKTLQGETYELQN